MSYGCANPPWRIHPSSSMPYGPPRTPSSHTPSILRTPQPLHGGHTWSASGRTLSSRGLGSVQGSASHVVVEVSPWPPGACRLHLNKRTEGQSPGLSTALVVLADSSRCPVYPLVGKGDPYSDQAGPSQGGQTPKKDRSSARGCLPNQPREDIAEPHPHQGATPPQAD